MNIPFWILNCDINIDLLETPENSEYYKISKLIMQAGKVPTQKCIYGTMLSADYYCYHYYCYCFKLHCDWKNLSIWHQLPEIKQMGNMHHWKCQFFPQKALSHLTDLARRSNAGAQICRFRGSVLVRPRNGITSVRTVAYRQDIGRTSATKLATAGDGRNVWTCLKKFADALWSEQRN